VILNGFLVDFPWNGLLSTYLSRSVRSFCFQVDMQH